MFLPKNTDAYIQLDKEYNHSKNVSLKKARQAIMYEIIDSDISNAGEVLKSLKNKIEPYKNAVKNHNNIADLRDQELEASKFGNYTNLRSFVFIFGITILLFIVSVSNLIKSFRSNQKNLHLSAKAYLILAVFMGIRIALPQDLPIWLYLTTFISILMILVFASVKYAESSKILHEKLSIALGMLFVIKHDYFADITAKFKYRDLVIEDKPLVDKEIDEKVKEFDNYFTSGLRKIND